MAVYLQCFRFNLQTKFSVVYSCVGDREQNSTY